MQCFWKFLFLWYLFTFYTLPLLDYNVCEMNQTSPLHFTLVTKITCYAGLSLFLLTRIQKASVVAESPL